MVPSCTPYEPETVPLQARQLGRVPNPPLRIVSGIKTQGFDQVIGGFGCDICLAE